MTNNVLEVKNLTKKFKKFTAVDNLSFSIKDGEILGLLGPNGAGKTTTIQMLLGVMEPTAGDISYFGNPFKENKTQVLKQINFSSTYISLPWLFTVNEILEVFSRLYEIPNRTKRIGKLLNEFEIGHLAKKQFHNLSAGEKTRVILAKAFINYPKVILLDEPTASLDVDIAIKIREFLKKEKREYKTSVLLTSHNMPEVEEMCDRVIILDHGKVLAEDTPENLAKSITNIKIELLIKKDANRAIEFLTKNKMLFQQDKFNFRITIEERKIAELLSALIKERIQYEEIDIKKPDLEDYFLQVIKK
jgi:ABC-2 type transport system ATP-binding protein